MAKRKKDNLDLSEDDLRGFKDEYASFQPLGITERDLKDPDEPDAEQDEDLDPDVREMLRHAPEEDDERGLIRSGRKVKKRSSEEILDDDQDEDDFYSRDKYEGDDYEDDY
jgi:hypothetical protein